MTAWAYLPALATSTSIAAIAAALIGLGWAPARTFQSGSRRAWALRAVVVVLLGGSAAVALALALVRVAAAGQV